MRADFRKVLKFVAHGMIKHPDLPDTGRSEQISLLGRGELPYFDQDEVHEIYRDWRALFDSYSGGRIGVAEAWASTQERLARYVRPDELHQAFNFALLEAPWSAAEFGAVISESLATTGQVGATTTWVLGNHDVRRPVTRYGDGELGLARARAAALLSFALPGSVYVYQGEELGLREVLDLPDRARQDPIWIRSGGTDVGRDGCRVPLPWSGHEPPFGFGPGGSWLPAPGEWGSSTVESQSEEPGSVLNLYRAALARRREVPALGDGELSWLETPEHVLAFARDPGFVCAANFGDRPVALDLPGELLIRSDSADRWTGELPANTTIWLTTGKSEREIRPPGLFLTN